MLVIMLGRFFARVGVVGNGIFHAVLTTARNARRHMGNRSQLRALATFDDNALHDIGISRSEVEGVLAGSLFGGPAQALLEREADRRLLVGLHQQAAGWSQGMRALPRKAIRLDQVCVQIAHRSGRESIA